MANRHRTALKMNVESALEHQHKIQAPTDTAHNKRNVKPVPEQLVQAGRSGQPENPLPP